MVDTEEMAVVPENLNQLRACLQCKLIKTYEQWQDSGCENCGQSVERFDHLTTWTTPKFVGFLSVMKPTQSWVARYRRQEKFVPGCYALAVRGKIPENEGSEYGDESVNG